MNDFSFCVNDLGLGEYDGLELRGGFGLACVGREL
jgi:hypothetical protein